MHEYNTIYLVGKCSLCSLHDIIPFSQRMIVFHGDEGQPMMSESKTFKEVLMRDLKLHLIIS